LRAKDFDLIERAAKAIEGPCNRPEAYATALEEEPLDVDNIIDGFYVGIRAIEHARFAGTAQLCAAEPEGTASRGYVSIEDEVAELFQFIIFAFIERTSQSSFPQPPLVIDNPIDDLIPTF
jgi:hypothetical protein